MTVVTTADTSQLYALAARHGLKLHGPLTVNELGLDYRIVIATVDDGRRWVLRIPPTHQTGRENIRYNTFVPSGVSCRRMHSAVTIGCSVPNVKVMHRQKLRAGSMPGEKYTMYERHLF